MNVCNKILGLIAVGAIGILASGCGKGLPATAPVKGKITWNGKPVECGSITFYPEKGRPATGIIQPDGSYRLSTFKDGDGALLGKHKVTILATRISNQAVPKSFEEEVRGLGKFDPQQSAVKWLVPEHYSRPETTPLTAEVFKGRNEINFALP